MCPRAGILAIALAACTAPAPAPPTSQARKELLQRLPGAEREKVAASTVPVLLPRSVPLTFAKLVVERTYTALHDPLPGVTLSLHASRIAHHYDDIPATPGPHPMRGTSGYVSMNEGIWTATWIEQGVAYALDVECAQAGDARCADEGYLMSLVETLDPVGP